MGGGRGRISREVGGMSSQAGTDTELDALSTGRTRALPDLTGRGIEHKCGLEFLVHLACLVDVGPIVEQQLDDLEVAVQDGQAEGRDSSLKKRERETEMKRCIIILIILILIIIIIIVIIVQILSFI